MSERSISGSNLSKAITSEDILGKDVLDRAGDVIGVVEKVLIDPTTFSVLGISIDKGFLHKGLSIGKGYITKVTAHAVFLKIRVPYQLKGMKVFDADGVILGHVVAIELQTRTNRIGTLVVRPRFFVPGVTANLVIPATQIISTGDNIVLKVKKKEVIAKQPNDLTKSE